MSMNAPIDKITRTLMDGLSATKGRNTKKVAELLEGKSFMRDIELNENDLKNIGEKLPYNLIRTEADLRMYVLEIIRSS